jgi:hypothetical protein
VVPKEEATMRNTKFLAMGLVLGGGIGILVGAAQNNIPMGIVFGGGFGLIIGLILAWATGRRAVGRQK